MMFEMIPFAVGSDNASILSLAYWHRFQHVQGPNQMHIASMMPLALKLPSYFCLNKAPALPNQGGLYDTFSDWERDFTLVHSNRSHASAVASRVGAFEVHLIGEYWNPNLCSGELFVNEEHGGPAIYGSWGICVKDNEKKLCQRHTLLHSKLWTRRWPAIATLVGQIEALVIQPPPTRIEALVIQPPPTIMPVPLRHVPFKREQCPSLPSAFASRSMVTMLTVSDSDRRPAILKDLASLLSLKCSNCPHEDWQIAGGIGTGRQQADADSDTFSACKCGHTLNFYEISSMLRSYHLFSASQLGNSWRDLRDAGWRGRQGAETLGFACWNMVTVLIFVSPSNAPSLGCLIGFSPYQEIGYFHQPLRWGATCCW